LSGDDEQLFWLEGQPKPANKNDMNWAIDYIVEPGYLKALGVPMLRGRFFTAQDDENAPLVAVVDEEFARKYFPGQDPIGKRIHLDRFDRPAEIVGIVGHVKQWGLDTDDQQSLRSGLYIPCMQMPDDFVAMSPTSSTVVVRTAGSPAGLLDSIRQMNAQMSNQQVIYGVQTMESLISDSLAARRFSMILLGIFAVLALLLASVGIYGVISYVVGQRTNEIGLRMALGARQRDILLLILGRGGKLALLGVAIGLAAALGLTRLMTSLLYGVGATDPLTFAGVAVLLTVVALAACYIPARRAANVDPMVALRYE
jgi:predicted permease